MKLKAVTFLFLIASFGARANIYGKDNRVPFHAISDQKIKALASSSIAIVPKERLVSKYSSFILKGTSLQNLLNFCAEVPFAQEELIANCSGALIAPDLVLTAAHCLEASDAFEKYVAVFNYKQNSPGQKTFEVSEEDVFEFSKFEFYQFDQYRGVDLALVRLSRKSTVTPLEVDFKVPAVGTPLFTLGYPLGVPLKLADDSEIQSVDLLDQSFRHQLDTFSVNSGSPIFNAKTLKIIGVHARGTGTNYMPHPKRPCNVWDVGDTKKDFNEANFLSVFEQL